MIQGWICPRCSLVLHPNIVEHRCEDGPASFPWAPASPSPFAPWPATAGTATAPYWLTVTASPNVISISPDIGYVNPGSSTPGGTTSVCGPLAA